MSQPSFWLKQFERTGQPGMWKWHCGHKPLWTGVLHDFCFSLYTSYHSAGYFVFSDHFCLPHWAVVRGYGLVHPWLPSKELDAWAQGSACWKNDSRVRRGGVSLSLLMLVLSVIFWLGFAHSECLLPGLHHTSIPQLNILLEGLSLVSELVEQWMAS